MRSKQKVFVGMSGGVDSSVACALLLEQGYEVEGITLKLCESAEKCGSGEFEDAINMAKLLGIKHHIIDETKLFKEKITDYFTNTYLEGKTPNPCIMCNKHIKFGAMREHVRRLGGDFIATGHYAKIEHDGHGYHLKKAPTDKDQSYFLYRLNEDALAKTLFPLSGLIQNGQLSKADVRAAAERYGLPVSSKPDSQDICFIPDGKYADFVKKNSGIEAAQGDFVDISGNLLGRHNGIFGYTVGQRKGLGLSSVAPLYVKEIDVISNKITLCEEKELYSKRLTAENISFINQSEILPRMKVLAKPRYRAPAAEALMTVHDNFIEVDFDVPQRAVTPGQSVVIYNGDIVLGGGVIV